MRIEVVLFAAVLGLAGAATAQAPDQSSDTVPGAPDVIASQTIETTLEPVAADPLGEQVDELVRLPGQGKVKPESPYGHPRIARASHLVPGGGLMMSFDANSNGRITLEEMLSGTRAAFEAADTNGDGALTALEQQAWADSLPTHDDTLANPVRFDPNLDRSVSVDEFTSVISQLGEAYAEENSGDIVVSSLTAKDAEKPERTRQRPNPRRQVPNRH